MTVVFYIAAAVAVISTLLVITRRNTLHALLYLVVSLLAVAVVFSALGAPFVAALEVIVYAGAIIVLFLFAVMLLNIGRDDDAERARRAATDRLDRAGPAGRRAARRARLGDQHRRDGPGRRPLVGPREVGVALYGPMPSASSWPRSCCWPP